MVSDSTLRMRQSELSRLRTDLSRTSSTVAEARLRASKATQAATSTRSDSTRTSRLREAAREEQKAIEAEKKRGQLEKRIAQKEKSVFEAQRQYDRELDRERQRAMQRMTASIDAREHQFRPTASTLDLSISEEEPSSADNRGRIFGSDTPVLHTSDVFISHASEDKDEIARPLKDALETRGVRVWFDELSIGWGEPLHRAISEGIANARFGLVIISPSFMKKKWTKAELDALFGRQMGMKDGYGVILPLWHRVTADEVQTNLPMIASLKAHNTSVVSVDGIADMIANLLRPEGH